MKFTGHPSLRWISATVACCCALPACTSPMQRSSEQSLREEMLAAHQSYLSQMASGPVIEMDRPKGPVEEELTPERRAELDKISGVTAYSDQPLNLGKDLVGNQTTPTVKMNLQESIRLAVRHNIEGRGARLVPAVAQTQVTQAQAAFDASFFTTLNVSRLDEPSLFLPGGFQRSDTDGLITGIRKPLTTGGELTVQTQWARNYFNPLSVVTGPGEFYTADVSLALRQPLLKNFGTAVSTAQIELARSGTEQGQQDLHNTLLEVALGTEQAYWNLYFAREQLRIQERLLQRTIEDYKRVKQRANFDVNPVRQTEAGSFVESRRAVVISARQGVRIASDNLKRLLNAPDLPLSGETLIQPTDVPADAPIKFNLLDAVSNALRNRPDLRKALWLIRDASTRLMVADNQRLPQLDLSTSLKFNGLGGSESRAYDNIGTGDYIDFILGLQFQVPIGNRAPEALFQQRTFERQSSVLSYQKTAQDALLQIKTAMRNLFTSYELIGAARAARRAAADNLRAIEKQEEAGVALTPEFLLDLKLNSQQRLADAETAELRALTDYNSAVAAYYRTLGTLLQRDGIKFDDSPAN